MFGSLGSFFEFDLEGPGGRDVDVGRDEVLEPLSEVHDALLREVHVAARVGIGQLRARAGDDPIDAAVESEREKRCGTSMSGSVIGFSAVAYTPALLCARYGMRPKNFAA